MYEIPLFPLNTVLFPGAPIFLNIFEPRYKEMFSYCVKNDKPFGVVLIQDGQEIGGMATPHAIGCTARIVQSETQANGNIHLVAVGEQRFRILALQQDKPYLVGQVMGFPMQRPRDEAVLVPVNKALNESLMAYISMLGQFGETNFEQDELPQDAIELGYLAAYLLQAPVDQKQAFLDEGDGGKFLSSLMATLRFETRILQAIFTQSNAPGQPDSLFSLN